MTRGTTDTVSITVGMIRFRPGIGALHAQTSITGIHRNRTDTSLCTPFYPPCCCLPADPRRSPRQLQDCIARRLVQERGSLLNQSIFGGGPSRGLTSAGLSGRGVHSPQYLRAQTSLLSPGHRHRRCRHLGRVGGVRLVSPRLD